ncbi:hypothetical protein VTP01DRAFT_9629 [Rhizomucor pusillus]|uniref:uncharacterized protein n=1 Tax=Rhizomucor pusillus TaxID=4840 RepID=UPI003743611E
MLPIHDHACTVTVLCKHCILTFPLWSYWSIEGLESLGMRHSLQGFPDIIIVGKHLIGRDSKEPSTLLDQIYEIHFDRADRSTEALCNPRHYASRTCLSTSNSVLMLA